MPTPVYFADSRSRSAGANKCAKIAALCRAAGLADIVPKGARTAVKLHFGERGNDCHIQPAHAQVVVAALNALGALPFLTDTNTLYRGSRGNSVDHLRTAAEHGFVPGVVDAPVVIADGLAGNNERHAPVPNGKRFDTARLAGDIVDADAMVVLSHFKGHILAGFGGAIKNLAMGCATPAGKREQHDIRFEVDGAKCVACGACVDVCPERAVNLPGPGTDKAAIDKAACIGCGECYATCPEGAIGLDWQTDVGDFMERMTEYALAAHSIHKGRVLYVNFVTNVTPDCDCLPWSDAPIVPDVGVLAGADPVAVDTASRDLVNACAGFAGSHLSCNLEEHAHKFAGLWPNAKPDAQLTYGQEIGLGSMDYELVKVEVGDDGTPAH